MRIKYEIFSINCKIYLSREQSLSYLKMVNLMKKADLSYSGPCIIRDKNLKGKFPQTTIWIGWVECNVRNPTVKF